MENPKILVIDDEPRNLKLVEACLSPNGYDVVTAASGQEALKMLGTLRPRLIILDVNMPGMSGITFFEKITDIDGLPRYPVLVLTARDNLGEMFRNFSVDGFMTKPFELSRLVAEVGVILSRHVPHDLQDAQEKEKPKKALIVENDQAAQERCAAHFVREGFTVTGAKTGAQGLERAFIEPPEFVLVNLKLPDMPGDIFIIKLRKMPKTAEVEPVLYSSSGDDLDPSITARLCAKLGICEIVGTGEPRALFKAVEARLKG